MSTRFIPFYERGKCVAYLAYERPGGWRGRVKDWRMARDCRNAQLRPRATVPAGCDHAAGAVESGTSERSQSVAGGDGGPK